MKLFPLSFPSVAIVIAGGLWSGCPAHLTEPSIRPDGPKKCQLEEVTYNVVSVNDANDNKLILDNLRVVLNGWLSTRYLTAPGVTSIYDKYLSTINQIRSRKQFMVSQDVVDKAVALRNLGCSLTSGLFHGKLEDEAQKLYLDIIRAQTGTQPARAANSKDLQPVIELITQGYLNTYKCGILKVGRTVLNQLCKKKPCDRGYFFNNIYNAKISTQLQIIRNACDIFKDQMNTILGSDNYSLDCSSTGAWFLRYQDTSWAEFPKQNSDSRFHLLLIKTLLWDNLGASEADRQTAVIPFTDLWMNALGNEYFRKARSQWEALQANCQDCTVSITGIDSTAKDWSIVSAVIFGRVLEYFSNEALKFQPGCGIDINEGKWALDYVYQNRRWELLSRCQAGVCLTDLPPPTQDILLKAVAHKFAEELITPTVANKAE